MRIRECFMNLANRNKRFKELQQEGYTNLKKRSHRGQIMHPQYIKDYTQETGIKLNSSNCGIGNTIYKTLFPVIYIIEERRF